MDNIYLTGEAAARAAGAGQASHSGSSLPHAEAKKPQEVSAALTPPVSAAGVPTGGSSTHVSDAVVTRMPRKGESLSDYMADAPIVADAPDGPVLEAKLSPGQLSVLREIMAGKSIMAAAKSTRVSRSTIYRWQSEDANYIAALNAWKRQMDESVRHRLVALADRAVTALNNALLTCDAKTAVSLLKGLGMLSPVKHGETDVEVVKRSLKLQEWENRARIWKQDQSLWDWPRDPRWERKYKHELNS